MTCDRPGRTRRARDGPRPLSERRLAACVQVLGPMRSTYRWQGKVEDRVRVALPGQDHAAARSRKLVAAVRLHPYDTPEVVALPMTLAAGRYLDWLTASVRPSAQRRDRACR